jgi:hypothetical protein
MKNLFLLFGLIGSVGLAEIPPIYRMVQRDLNSGEMFHFISLSESLEMSDHPDSCIIPTEFVGDIYRSDVDLVPLDGTYRDKFLKGVGLTEFDSLFIYDYILDSIVSFPVRGLTACAVPNINLAKEDLLDYCSIYQIGFKIDNLEVQNNHFEKSFAAFAQSCPFQKGKMEPVKWTPVDTAQMPKVQHREEFGRILTNLELNGSFIYKQNQYILYLFDLYDDGRPFGRHLIVMDTLTDEIKVDQQFYESSGPAGTPINSGENIEDMFQWTGILFKNYPSVIFGFEYHIMYCDPIYFLANDEYSIRVKCDIRY